MLKREKRHLPHAREASPSLLRAVLVGLGAFVISAFLLSLLATVIAYGQRDPDAFLFIGSLCPFLSAVLGGAISGRLYPTRAWLGGGITGLVASALMWLLSAGMEARLGAGQTLLLHLAVAAVAILSSALLGPRHPKRKHRYSR